MAKFDKFAGSQLRELARIFQLENYAGNKEKTIKCVFDFLKAPAATKKAERVAAKVYSSLMASNIDH